MFRQLIYNLILYTIKKVYITIYYINNFTEIISKIVNNFTPSIQVLSKNKIRPKTFEEECKLK